MIFLHLLFLLTTVFLRFFPDTAHIWESLSLWDSTSYNLLSRSIVFVCYYRWSQYKHSHVCLLQHAQRSRLPHNPRGHHSLWRLHKQRPLEQRGCTNLGSYPGDRVPACSLSLSTLDIVRLLNFCSSRSCEMVSHCGFTMHFLLS